jgi:glycosyltransferase involved in cell wall biosynthesis
LLVAAIDLIKEAVPNFHFIVVGDGPEGSIVREAASSRNWVHSVGVLKGHDKAVLFKMSHVQLNPGLVGLHVLDAFSAGLPMITTSNSLHSPEIAYLQDGVNGVVVDGDNVHDYAQTVVELLLNDLSRNIMAERCRADALKYTVENMAVNFAGGVLAALK